MKEFICVDCHYKKNSKMWINGHQKKGCDKVVDSKGNPFKLKLYPPLRNTTEGVYFAKGGNILEYNAKVNALSKPRSNHPSTTLILQLIQKSKHKRKKDKTPPLEKDFQEDSKGF
jgi:hypothetical protein